jgi:phenylalanine-4-hydroxylase
MDKMKWPTFSFQPFFPRSLEDITLSVGRIMTHGRDFVGRDEHPMYSDVDYVERIHSIKELASKSRNLEAPVITYTEQENMTWSVIWNRLEVLHAKFASKVFLEGKKILCDNGVLLKDKVPSLKDLSVVIQRLTGFRVVPVAGMLSSRDFLNALAFRVFHATQYIRHHVQPFYSPEPDICHEVIGHLPMLTNRTFAKLSQQIGLASLGASDQVIHELSNIYWFTLEWGVVREEGSMKAFGAGLLAAAGELEDFGNGNVEVHGFTLKEAINHSERTVTTTQKKLLCCENFLQVQTQLKHWERQQSRPFMPYYDPYTETILTFANSPPDVLSSLIDSVDSLESLRLSLFNQ